MQESPEKQPPAGSGICEIALGPAKGTYPARYSSQVSGLTIIRTSGHKHVTLVPVDSGSCGNNLSISSTPEPGAIISFFHSTTRYISLSLLPLLLVVFCLAIDSRWWFSAFSVDRRRIIDRETLSETSDRSIEGGGSVYNKRAHGE